MELKGSIIAITGGSSGLGKALARLFVERGATVVIGGRDKDKLESAATEVGAESIVTDVTDEATVKQFGQSVEKKYGRIDVWVNNAGVRIPHGPVEDMNIWRFHQMMETNLFGMVYGSRQAIRAMKPRGAGMIINILSTSALDGRANLSAYAASKFAALGFSKSLRAEMTPLGITVVNVYPGGMRTHFFDEQKPDDYDEYMDPALVAGKIVDNAAQAKPEEELIIKRPKIS